MNPAKPVVQYTKGEVKELLAQDLQTLGYVVNIASVSAKDVAFGSVPAYRYEFRAADSSGNNRLCFAYAFVRGGSCAPSLTSPCAIPRNFAPPSMPLTLDRGGPYLRCGSWRSSIFCTARRGAVEQDMVRIDPMTAIPRWEERTVLQENHMKLFLNGVPEETLVVHAHRAFRSGAGASVYRRTHCRGRGCVLYCGQRRRHTGGGGYARSGEPVRSAGGGRRGKSALRRRGDFRWEPRWIYALGRAFHAGAPLYRATHGIHSCFLMQDGEILYCCEDIGRHNALDKAVGRALMDGVDLRRCVLFSSGRIPADMMEKAIRAGVPLLASNAVPTDRAVALARAYRVVLICTARSDSMNIFADKYLWGT